MTEFFIDANSFAAPFISDSSTAFVEAADPREALDRFAADYRHPAGLYSADAYASADAYQKGGKPLAMWRSNHVLAMEKATAGLTGYSVLGHGPGKFEIDGKLIEVEDPKGGRVIGAGW